MDLLNINFNDYIPAAVDALAHVYGEKYRASIQEKLNKAIMFYFYDIPSLKRYIDDLKENQIKKGSLEFFKAMGISDDKTEEAFNNLICNSDYLVNGESPILAFSDNFDSRVYSEAAAKVQVINFFLEPAGVHIEEADYELFSKTGKYKVIESRVKRILEKYENYLDKYLDLFEYLEDVRLYIEAEKEREKAVKHYYAKKFCKDIMYMVPYKAQAILLKKYSQDELDKYEPTDDYLEHLVPIFLPPYREDDPFDQLDEISCFEAFSQKSRDEETNVMVEAIKAKQRTYLDALGISYEDEKEYLPDEKQTRQIKEFRKWAKRDYIDYYLLSRQDFINFMVSFKPLDANDPLFRRFKDKIKEYQAGNYDACVCSHMYRDDDETLRSIMVYSLRKMGNLFYYFLHECTHIDEQRDSSDVGFDNDPSENKYNPKYRQCERFNETLSDIFTREGLRYLHEKGIFLMEPEEITNMDNSNLNTTAEDAKLLEPLLANPIYREAIVKVKNGVNPSIFINLIGEENFNKLIDLLNYVDFLSSNKDFYNSNKPKVSDELKNKYGLALIEAEDLYHNIDKHIKETAVQASV